MASPCFSVLLTSSLHLCIGQSPKAKAAAAQSQGKGKGKGVPWFAFGFVGVATINSVWGIPASLQRLFASASACFLASAMAALGLDTDLVKVRPPRGLH